jgi:hypothetical protein
MTAPTVLTRWLEPPDGVQATNRRGCKRGKGRRPVNLPWRARIALVYNQTKPLRPPPMRVNMSKFLPTVCAFALLLSSALAQEKSLEQLREERSHIYGIEGQRNETITRIVASGGKRRLDFYTSLNPDCTMSGDINVRVIKQPEHGTVDTVVATEYAHYPKENIRSKCNQHRVKGILVNYKAAEKYTGSDDFDLLVLYPHGTAWEIHYNITVR